MVAGSRAGRDVDEPFEIIKLAGGVERVHGAKQIDFDDALRVRHLPVPPGSDGGGMHDLRYAVLACGGEHGLGISDVSMDEDHLLDRRTK